MGGFGPGLGQPGVPPQAQVVVGTEIQARGRADGSLQSPARTLIRGGSQPLHPGGGNFAFPDGIGGDRPGLIAWNFRGFHGFAMLGFTFGPNADSGLRLETYPAFFTFTLQP